MEKQNVVIVLIVLTALLLGAILYFVLLPTQLNEQVQEAYRLYHSGADSGQAALKNLEKAELSPVQKAYVEAAIAFDLVRSAEGDNVLTAIRKIKQGIADTAQTGNENSSIQAGRVNILLDFAISNYRKEVIDEIFSGEPYSNFLAEARGDTGLGIVKLQEWSIELYPTSFAHMRLAGMYADLALVAASRNTKKNYFANAKENLSAGEGLLDRDAAFNTRERQLLLHTLRATAYGILARGKQVPVTQAEESFKQALDLSIRAVAEQPHNIYFYSHELTTRYKYAAFLALLRDPSRNAAISEILKPYGALGPADVNKYMFVQSIRSAITSNGGKPMPIMSRFAAVSPEFKAFLTRMTQE